MKNPTWEPSAGNLLAFLNTNTELMMVELYSISTSSGTTGYMTSGELAVTCNGITYQIGARIDRSKVTSTVGIELSTLNVDFYGDSSVMVAGVNFLSALATGYFDNGRLRVERLFMNSAGVQQGTILIFEGSIGQVITNRGHAQVEVLSDTQLLDVMIPSAVYQPSCRNTFCDQNCGLQAANFTQSGTVSAAPDATNQSFVANFTSTPAATAGYLSLGYVAFTSGQNAGATKTIKIHSGTNTGTIQMTSGLLKSIAVGDAFTVTAGCDKTMVTCAAKFSNVANFSGEPFIPLPQTVT